MSDDQTHLGTIEAYLSLPSDRRHNFLIAQRENAATRTELITALSAVSDVLIGLTEAALELSSENREATLKLRAAVAGLQQLSSLISLIAADASTMSLRNEEADE